MALLVTLVGPMVLALAPLAIGGLALLFLALACLPIALLVLFAVRAAVDLYA